MASFTKTEPITLKEMVYRLKISKFKREEKEYQDKIFYLKLEIKRLKNPLRL